MTAQVLCECSRFQAQTGVENPIVSWSELRGQMGSGRLRWLGSEGQERGEGTDKILREFMTRGAAVGQEQ